METTKTHENYYRRQAKRLDLSLEKSHGRKWRVTNQQGWRIVDNSGYVLAGEKWELTIEEVVKFLDGYEERLKSK
jgi:hypothetical protein